MDLAQLIRRLRRKMTPDMRAQVYKRISEPSKPSASFYLMVSLSAIIATLGLLANSTAVVIGAMLVAPLMSPIFGIALGLTLGDRRLLTTALVAESAGVLLAIVLPVVIGLIPMRPDFGTEILARTQPTVYDILIALASGLAGAYALVDEKISPALPGVAIATALVPPLAACGLNIAAANWILAGGAFLLFAVNFVAIEFAAALVFTWSGAVGFSPTSGGTLMKSIFQRLGISMLILLIAASFMTQTLVKIVAERKQDNDIRTVLSEQLSTVAGARLSDIKLDQGSAGLQVIATVTTTQEFEPSQVARWEDVLQARIDPGARLIVRTVLSKDIDRSGLVFMSQEDLIRHHQISEESRYMNEVSRVVSSYIQTVAGVQVTDVSKTSQEKGAQITITVRTPTAMTPSQVQQLQDRLRQDVDEEIVLVVRSVLTTDADAEGFMHMPLDFAATLEGEDQELYRRLTNDVAWYLGQQVEGVKLERLRFDYLGENAIRVEA
ncbi:MAG: TIGR00341 family protein, partial [Syntrophomonas sp.]|nr:TIGR00341 family protein [Syntrophomonas sp.]